MKKILKKTQSFRHIKKTRLAGLVILGLAVATYFAYKSVVVSPKVAEIAQTTSSACKTNIASISFHDECGKGMFKRAVYTCANGSTADKMSSSNCFSQESLLEEARNNCGQTCPVQATVVPRPSSTPAPSCVPNPCKDGAVCKLMALPAGQVYCPTSSTTPRKSTPVSTPPSSDR
jgi:hypothetical protein